jgi:hypothetical protein
MKTTLIIMGLSVALTPFFANAAEIYDGANGSWNKDTWNTATNWNGGGGPVPSGTTDVEIAAGKKASVNSGLAGVSATPFYDGNLTLQTNAALEFGQFPDGALSDNNALGTGTITMNSGTDITFRTPVNTAYSNDLILLGDALIALGRSTSAHHETRTWNGTISGTGLLTIHSTNNNALFLTNTNSWSGGLLAGGSESENKSERIKAQAVGALGTGDVQMDTGVSLFFDADEVMANAATLTLNGTKSSRDPAFLVLADNTNTSVSGFVVNGTSMLPGVYDSSSGLLDLSGNNLISGGGTLTVIIPEPASIALVGLGGLAMLARRKA